MKPKLLGGLFSLALALQVGGAEAQKSKSPPVNLQARPVDEAARRRAIAADAENARLLSEEQTILNQISAIRTRTFEQQVEIDRLRSLHRKNAANVLKNEQQTLLDRSVKLKARVDEIRDQRDKLERSEQGIRDEIAQLKKRDAALEKEIDHWTTSPQGHGRHGLANALKSDRKDTKERIGKLEARVS